MSGVARRFIAALSALVLFGSPTVAIASSDRPLYRTVDQAAAYLQRGLDHWSGLDLRKFRSKTAFCVSASDQSGSPSQVRANRDGVPVYRSFSCVLNVTVSSGKNGTRVFQLDLTRERHGWHIASDSA